MRNKSLDTEPAQAFILKYVKQYWICTSGSTAIEYGLLASLISVMFITGASALGDGVNGKFSDISELLSGPPEQASTNRAP